MGGVSLGKAGLVASKQLDKAGAGCWVPGAGEKQKIKDSTQRLEGTKKSGRRQMADGRRERITDRHLVL